MTRCGSNRDFARYCVSVVCEMMCVRSVWASGVLTVVVAIGGIIGQCQAAGTPGGYNSMDVNSVYHDNGRDSVNARAMLAAMTQNASYYRRGRDVSTAVRFAGRKVSTAPARTANRPPSDNRGLYPR